MSPDAPDVPAGRVRVGPEPGYAVEVGAGLLAELVERADELLPGRSLAVVSDSNVMPLHGAPAADRFRAAGRRVSTHVFPAGEASKTRKTWSILTDEMLESGHGRDAAVVAVGGGVTTDLGGFVAATYLRGVPVLQIPTSLLAMIDASTGGKTGVDVRAGKNLVGAFHRPVAVVADVDTLSTLPRDQRAEGLVEAVKHGAILDAGHFEALGRELGALLDADPERTAEVVRASVALKASVVAEDERESGYRQILNFGHTIGHAVEAAAGYRLGHGSAVALGMRAEARIGEQIGVTEAGTADRLDDLLGRLLGPVRASVGVADALAFLGADKKVRAGRPRFVLLAGIGRTDPGEGWTRTVPDEVVEDALRRVLDAG